MRRTLKQTIIILLVITICITSMPTEVLGSTATVNGETKLTLKNIGKKKTLYQYLEFTIKTNVDVTKCQFKSSNKKVATIKKGVITAKRKGKTTITVKYGSQNMSIKLTVKKSGNKYNPKRVTQIANQRMKKTKNNNGIKYTYMPDWLSQQLKDGEITKEEYDEYYPDCGGSYLIIYYTTKLDTLWKLGKKLNTESDIANDIIEFYKARNWDCYYIEYIGKKKRSGKMYHVFHLYNGKK